ncbi:methyltransferase domain-containing protein [Phyllobacterium sp. BT25]|uniref:Methyltransferase domain-containing protein n=1 Tax=Phyllobacterium pellucidum TaxID=2740464 RepID=A0A849VYR0_9HYPH|nr:class I SAM-dependent methyltransferase [Phyllobacterium pellucidum]NTS33040.1 methyltransferase domain-containing protein [Phyllobacterium pellucidum]
MELDIGVRHPMREEAENHHDFKGLTTDYFDRRSETYDQDAIFPKLAFVIIRHADIEPGHCVLDIGTGTGRLALQAAKMVGDEGGVVAIDLSAEMLTQAHFKAGMDNLSNIQFIQGDVEEATFDNNAFDRILCSSAFVLLSDPHAALRQWNRWLKSGGMVTFDAPGEPFGINSIIAEVAEAHGIDLPYATIANTVEKCKELLESSGFEVAEISPELMQEHRMLTEEALFVWEKSLAHPAWHQLNLLPAKELEQLRKDFETKVHAKANDGTIVSKIIMHVVTGRKKTDGV